MPVDKCVEDHSRTAPSGPLDQPSNQLEQKVTTFRWCNKISDLRNEARAPLAAGNKFLLFYRPLHVVVHNRKRLSPCTDWRSAA